MKTRTLAEELEAAQKLLQSYQDLAVEQEDDDAFVARGNGFCDRKYSDDFIEGQLEKYAQRVKEIQKWIIEWE